MTQIVKSFRGGGLGEVPFSKGTSPSKYKQHSRTHINVQQCDKAIDNPRRVWYNFIDDSS